MNPDPANPLHAPLVADDCGPAKLSFVASFERRLFVCHSDGHRMHGALTDSAGARGLREVGHPLFSTNDITPLPCLPSLAEIEAISFARAYDPSQPTLDIGPVIVRARYLKDALRHTGEGPSAEIRKVGELPALFLRSSDGSRIAMIAPTRVSKADARLLPAAPTTRGPLLNEEEMNTLRRAHELGKRIAASSDLGIPMRDLGDRMAGAAKAILRKAK